MNAETLGATMSPHDQSFDISFAETPEEREAIYRQRYSVYTEEMHLYQSKADHERHVLMDAYDPACRLLYARVHDEVVGSLRIHLDQDAAIPDAFKKVYDLDKFSGTVPFDKIGIVTRFMVNPRCRGTSLTLRLVEASYEFLLQQRAELCFIACAPHLVNLYLALGFRTYTRNFNDPEVGFVIPMVAGCRDLGYFKRIASPMSVVAEKHVREVPSWIASVFPSDSTVWSERGGGEQYWSQAYSLLTDKSNGKYSIFDGLSEEEAKLLLSKGHVIECAKGELILRKGSVSHGISVILSGVVEIREGNRILAVLGRDEVIGEIGFLLEAPRSADVCAASEHVRILSLDDRTLRKLIETDPVTSAMLMFNLSRILCLRLVAAQSLA